MLTNCFRFAPRDSVPGLIAKICKYLKDHPGWSEEELEEHIKQFIGQTGVESFNGRTGSVVLNEDDVNNLKIASAYFAEGDETIDELDLVSIYNQGVRFVFTNWNSVTSGYDLAFVLDYFSGSNDVVYYPMATGSGGGGNIVSVNGKTGIVKLSLSDILGDSGAQVKLCTATEFTSTTLTTWNEYYDSGYRLVGVVNGNATAVDYLYLLKQGEHNHRPIVLTTGSGAVASVNGKTGAVIVGEAGVVEKESDANQYTQIFVDESEDYPPLDADLLDGKAGKYYLSPMNLLDNSDFTNPVNQRGLTSYSGYGYVFDRWKNDHADLTTKIKNGYVSIENNGTTTRSFVQIMPKNYVGKTLTLAVCDSTGNIYAKSDIVPEVDPNNGKIFCALYFDPLAIRMYLAKTGILNVDIRIGGGATFNLKWAALYEGAYTAETLPPFVPKGYAVELAECQRYFERLKAYQTYHSFGTGLIQTSVLAIVPIHYTEKRIAVPTVTANGSLRIKGVSNYGVSAISFGQTGAKSCLASATITGATAGQCGVLQANGDATAYIDISADL